MAITRSRLVQRLASCADISQRDADTAVSAVFETMSQVLIAGDRIEMRGFGSFSLRQRPAREARNPRTGEAVPVAAMKVVHFKAGRQLQQIVNNDQKALAVFREKQHAQRRLRDEKRGQLSLF